jgi:hypothetical protein
MFCGTHMGLAAGLVCALFLFFCSRRLGLMDLAAGLPLLRSVSCAMATSSDFCLFFSGTNLLVASLFLSVETLLQLPTHELTL